MDQRTILEIKERLIQRKQELLALIESAKAGTAPVAPDNAIGRLTRVDAMQSQQMAAALVEKNRQELARIDAAITRIDREEYGVCRRCGEAIAEPRLRAVPDALLCLPCAEKAATR